MSHQHRYLRRAFGTAEHEITPRWSIFTRDPLGLRRGRAQSRRYALWAAAELAREFPGCRPVLFWDERGRAAGVLVRYRSMPGGAIRLAICTGGIRLDGIHAYQFARALGLWGVEDDERFGYAARPDHPIVN